MPVYGLSVMRLQDKDSGAGSWPCDVMDVDPRMTTVSMHSVSYGKHRYADRRKRIYCLSCPLNSVDTAKQLILIPITKPVVG